MFTVVVVPREGMTKSRQTRRFVRAGGEINRRVPGITLSRSFLSEDESSQENLGLRKMEDESSTRRDSLLFNCF